MKHRSTFFTLYLTAVVGILLALAFAPGCVGAPHSAAELASMPQRDFDSWRSRLANACGTAAYAATKESAANLGACANVATALRALAGQPIGPKVVSDLAGTWAPFLGLALGELQAWLDQYRADEAALPRIAEVLLSCAEQIEVGAAQGLSQPQPVPGN